MCDASTATSAPDRFAVFGINLQGDPRLLDEAATLDEALAIARNAIAPPGWIEAEVEDSQAKPGEPLRWRVTFGGVEVERKDHARGPVEELSDRERHAGQLPGAGGYMDPSKPTDADAIGSKSALNDLCCDYCAGSGERVLHGDGEILSCDECDGTGTVLQ